MMAEIRKIKTSLTPLNDKLHSLSAGIESEIDFALLEFLMKTTNAPDLSLASDLVRGMPLAGHAVAAGSLRGRAPTLSTDVSELKLTLRENNEKIIRNLN